MKNIGNIYASFLCFSFTKPVRLDVDLLYMYYDC